MAKQILKVSEDFWNIRGEFKIGGVVNIGTHASLVRLRDGNYVLLDAYTLTDEVKAEVDVVTDNGAKLAAIINLHPFHTVHVSRAHQQYPKAKLYGTCRHHQKFPDLPWQPQLTESPEFAALFAADLEFSVPAGVDFVASNENLHFASVLAYHPASKTIHSDDTLMYLQLPGVLGRLKKPQVSFHMTLAMTLQKRAGAANEFRQWAQQLTEQWRAAENLCAAHSASLLGPQNAGASVAQRIQVALDNVEKTLRKHQQRFG